MTTTVLPAGWSVKRLDTFMCEVVSAGSLDATTRAFLVTHATRDGSDFQRTLASQLTADGTIALVYDQGEIIGWSRCERWEDKSSHLVWDTLESFVRPEWRGRGVASFAATGLRASGVIPTQFVAVFRPAMLLVASRAGLTPVLFELVDNQWREVK